MKLSAITPYSLRNARPFRNVWARRHLVLAGLLISCLTSAAAVADDVKVMSFNIRYGSAKDGENHWEKRKTLVAETIKAFSPDLLGTQETLGFQKQFLDAHLPAYTSIGVGRDDGGQAGEMTAIFFRTERFERLEEGHFWLSETSEVVGSKSWDSSLPRICSWIKLRDRQNDGQPILFVNTHFDHRGVEARKESAKLLRVKIDELGQGLACIVTGDVIASPESEPHRILFAGPTDSPAGSILLTDTFAKTHPDAANRGATFSGFRPNVLKGTRIDWIGVSKQWQIEAAEIDRTDYDGQTPSDHYPITATLKLVE